MYILSKEKQTRPAIQNQSPMDPFLSSRLENQGIFKIYKFCSFLCFAICFYLSAAVNVGKTVEQLHFTDQERELQKGYDFPEMVEHKGC